jgi:ADP-ribose pyrophosphatase
VAGLSDVREQWQVASQEDIWRGHAPFSVRRDLISAPGTDDTFGRLVIDHPGAVVVLAVDDDRRALVISQYRHPVGMRFIELPAGLLDQPGEDPVVAAQRELLEEGALRADRWAHLLTTYPSPGLSSERIEIFLAEGLTHVPDRGGFELHHEEAHLTTHWVQLDDLLAGVLSGAMTDGPLGQAVMAYVLGHTRAE